MIDKLPTELNLRSRLGPRPTLVVIARPPGGLPLAHSLSYYENFYFDTSSPNTFAWVMNAYGAPPMRILAGDIPVIDLTMEEAQLDMVPRAGAIMKRIIERVGLAPFQRIDDSGKNDDVLTPVELLLVCIDTYTSDLAATRLYTHDAGALKIDGNVSYVGHQASLMSVCHEVLHQWGAIDLYGADGSKNFFLTLMAATIFGVPDDRRSVELDPWHRMQFGLTAPLLVDFATQSAGNLNIRSVASDRESSAVLFWDSRKGKQDYYLVELREPTAGTVDSDVPEGFAVWVVRVDANGNPESPGNGIPGVAAIGKDLGQGSALMWQSGDQTPVLPWSDGGLSALTLGFEKPTRGNGTVSWSAMQIRPPPFNVPIARLIEAPAAVTFQTCSLGQRPAE